MLALATSMCYDFYVLKSKIIILMKCKIPRVRINCFVNRAPDKHSKNVLKLMLQISKLAQGDKSFFCDRCPRKKKITGATVEGTKVVP